MSWHGFQSFRCEYGIGSHSKKSLRLPDLADYPNLASKLIFPICNHKKHLLPATEGSSSPKSI